MTSELSTRSKGCYQRTTDGVKNLAKFFMKILKDDNGMIILNLLGKN